MAKGRLRRKVKELIGGKKTYRKSKTELEAGKIKRSLRRAKRRVTKETGPETTAQKDRRTRISSPAKSRVPSYSEWLKKTGKGTTAQSAREYRGVKKRNQ